MQYKRCWSSAESSTLDMLTMADLDRRDAHAVEIEMTAIIYLCGDDEERSAFARLYPTLVTSAPIKPHRGKRIVH